MIDLTHDDAVAQLEANVGQEVIALGVVGEIERPGETPHRKRTRHRTRKARAHDSDGSADRAVDTAAGEVDDVYEDGWAGDPDRPDERDDGTSTADSKPTSTPTAQAQAAQPAAEPTDGVSGSRPDAIGSKAPTRVILDNHVQLVFFDPEVFAASGISAWKGEWIRVSGKASLYHGKPEIVIDRTGQLELSPVPGLTKPTAARPTGSREHEKIVPTHAP